MVNSTEEFTLRKKIQEALRSGKYLITVTSFDEVTGKLSHYHIWNEFPEVDLVPSLSHIANEIEGIVTRGKENGKAD